MWDDRTVVEDDVQAVEGEALTWGARVEVGAFEGEGGDEKYSLIRN